MTVTDTSLEILEALDFDPEHECEHSNHGKVEWHYGPAAYLILARESTCPGCGETNEAETFALCAPAWERAGRQGLICFEPCEVVVPRDSAWSIVGRL